MKTVTLTLLLLFLLIYTVACEQERVISIETLCPPVAQSSTDRSPPNSHVPDEQTAISIAVAVWTPLYGKEQVEREKPYRASLKEGI
jgi:hypothetical protein